MWHLAAAAIGTDEGVAADLERVGGQAVARRAYAAGSGALERAARLTPAREAASRRLIAAGQASWGALLGNLAGTLAKLLIALAMISWFLVAVPAPF